VRLQTVAGGLFALGAKEVSEGVRQKVRGIGRVGEEDGAGEGVQFGGFAGGGQVFLVAGLGAAGVTAAKDPTQHYYNPVYPRLTLYLFLETAAHIREVLVGRAAGFKPSFVGH